MTKAGAGVFLIKIWAIRFQGTKKSVQSSGRTKTSIARLDK